MIKWNVILTFWLSETIPLLNVRHKEKDIL